MNKIIKLVIILLNIADYDKILEFIKGISEPDTNFQKNTIHLLKDLFGYNHLTFFLIDTKGNLSHATVHNVGNSLQHYNKYYYKVDIFHPTNISKNLLQKKVISITDILPLEQFKNTEYYNDFLKKHNLHYQIGIPLGTSNQLLGAIGLFRPKEIGNFTEDDLSKLQCLNDHITTNLKNHLTLANLKYEQYLYRNSSDNLPLGLFILDNNLTLLYINEHAKNYCCEITENDNVKESTQHIINLLSAKLFNQTIDKEIIIHNLSFRVVPSIVPSTYRSMESIFSVYIDKIVPNEELYLNKAAEKYTLTKREKEIVKLIMQDLKYREISEILYISVHTVKSLSQK